MPPSARRRLPCGRGSPAGGRARPGGGAVRARPCQRYPGRNPPPPCASDSDEAGRRGRSARPPSQTRPPAARGRRRDGRRPRWGTPARSHARGGREGTGGWGGDAPPRASLCSLPSARRPRRAGAGRGPSRPRHGAPPPPCNVHIHASNLPPAAVCRTRIPPHPLPPPPRSTGAARKPAAGIAPVSPGALGLRHRARWQPARTGPAGRPEPVATMFGGPGRPGGGRSRCGMDGDGQGK